MKIYVGNGSTHTNVFTHPHSHFPAHTPAHPLGWHFWFAFLINFGLCMLQLRLSLAAAASARPRPAQQPHATNTAFATDTDTDTDSAHMPVTYATHSPFPLNSLLRLVLFYAAASCCSRPDQLFCIFISWNFKFIRCLMCLMVRPASDLFLLHLWVTSKVATGSHFEPNTCPGTCAN